MPDIIITESQLQFVRKEIGNKELIKESEWYNTVMDVLGIVDPTPTIDLINGLSYISQGDNFFGFLSLISAVPYVGDFVAKPVTGALKIGGTAAKEVELALKLAKGGDFVKSEQILTKLAGETGAIGSFVKKGGEWGPKAMDMVERIPFGPFKGLKSTVKNWIGLFEKASINSKGIAKTAGGLAPKMVSSITKAEKEALLQTFLADVKGTSFFNKANFATSSKSVTNLWGGMPRLFGNREARALMRKTKFWAGFLDYIGLGNFVGPDEVSKKLGGEEEMKKMFAEYQKTDEGKKYFEEEFGKLSQKEKEETQPSKSTTSNVIDKASVIADPMSALFKKMLTGAVS